MKAHHLLWVVAAIVVVPRSAAGHTRSVSYSHWTGDDTTATVQVQLRTLDLSALNASLARGNTTLSAYLTGSLQLASGRTVCKPDATSVVRISARTGWQRYEWTTRCSGPATTLRSNLLVDIVSSHIHITRVQLSGRAAVEYVFSEDQRSIGLGSHAATNSRAAQAWHYARIGFAHLLSGWDHMVFLLVLVFVAASFRELALAVTGFTLGHSMTLALSATGYASANAHTVEALIGLSIALIAIENVWLKERRRSITLPVTAVAGLVAFAGLAMVTGTVSALAVVGVALFTACYFALVSGANNPAKLRWAVAAMFGLVHGFGFAGALNELSPSTEHLVVALAGFNLGVELGQLAVLAVAWPIVLLLRHQPTIRTWAVQVSSAAAVSVGLFWFVNRL